MRASGSLALLERTTTGLLGSVLFESDSELNRLIQFLLDIDLASGEDAPQWEEGAGGGGGGVNSEPGGSRASPNLQTT